MISDSEKIKLLAKRVFRIHLEINGSEEKNLDYFENQITQRIIFLTRFANNSEKIKKEFTYFSNCEFSFKEEIDYFVFNNLKGILDYLGEDNLNIIKEKLHLENCVINGKKDKGLTI